MFYCVDVMFVLDGREVFAGCYCAMCGRGGGVKGYVASDWLFEAHEGVALCTDDHGH